MIISKNRIGKILYYLKKGRVNVLINAIKLTFFNNNLNLINKRNKKSGKDLGKTKITLAALVFPIFETPVAVSIIIPVYNQWDYTYMCLKSILENTKDNNIPYEITIADDNSSDDTIGSIEKYVKNVKLIRNKNNLGFLKNCNNAAKYASGKYILFLNNDIDVQKDWLKNLLELLENNKSIGMAGPKFIYPDGTLLEAGGIIWKDGESWHYGRYDNPDRPEYNYIKEVDYISGACIMIEKKLFDNIGGFDEIYAPAYYEDADLAFEVRKRGYKVVYQPESVVAHYENITYKKSNIKNIKNRNKLKNIKEKNINKETNIKNTNKININNNDIKINQNNINGRDISNKEKFKQKWKYVLENEHYKQMTNILIAKDRGNKYGNNFKELKNNNKINRILIDCSETYNSDLKTGIQRVVRNIIERSERMENRLNIPVVPIILDTKGYITFKAFIIKKNNINNISNIHAAYNTHTIKNIHNILYRIANKYNNKFKININNVKTNIKEKIKIILTERLNIDENQNIYQFLKAVWRMLKKLKFFFIGLRQIFYFYIYKVNKIFNNNDKFSSESISIYHQYQCNKNNKKYNNKNSKKFNNNSNNEYNNGKYIDYYIVYPEENDLMLLADGFWSCRYNNYFNMFCKNIKKKNGVIIAVLYDIIALTNPEFFEKDFAVRFKKTLNKFLKTFDSILTISKSEMKMIKEYLNNFSGNPLSHKNRTGIKNIPVSFFYLGYDFNNKKRCFQNTNQYSVNIDDSFIGNTNIGNTNHGIFNSIDKDIDKYIGKDIDINMNRSDENNNNNNSIRENLFQLIDSVKQLNKIHKTDLTTSRIYLMVGTIEPR
ncbi:MAG: glycosyltransferase family 2 protein, partial [bacterium]